MNPSLSLLLALLCLLSVVAGCAPEPPPLPPALDALARFSGAIEQAKTLPACEVDLDLSVSPDGGIRLHCERPTLPVARARVPKGEP